MHGSIVGELGVESGNELTALLRGYDFVIDDRENFYATFDRFDIRRADKRHFDRFSAEFRNRIKASELTSVCVSNNGDVHGPKVRNGFVVDLFGKQDHSGAGSEDRQTVLNQITDRVHHVQIDKQLSHRGALAAGKDQPVERPIQVALFTNLEAFCAELFKHLPMFEKSALKSQNRYVHLICRAPPSAVRFRPR